MVRAMPNRPALIGAGITALYAGGGITAEDRGAVERLMSAAGETVWLDHEDQMDAVTAISGSGPAYFFLLIEALEAAGIEIGLPHETARRLAVATARGAGRMAAESGLEPATLREQVTSKGGTTAAALEVLGAQRIARDRPPRRGSGCPSFDRARGAVGETRDAMAAILFVLDALLTLLVVAFLLRAVMPLVRADFRNPLGQAVLRLTDPLVRPLRRILGPVRRVDVASFAALLLVQFAGAALIRLVAGGGIDLAGTLVAALVSLIQTVLRFYSVAVLAYVVLSWIAPGTHSPATRLLGALCEPLLGPVRRVLPPVAGLDLAPLFVLIGLQALQILLR